MCIDECNQWLAVRTHASKLGCSADLAGNTGLGNLYRQLYGYADHMAYVAMRHYNGIETTLHGGAVTRYSNEIAVQS